MRDAITGLIGRYDQLGRYLDREAIDRIAGYYGESAVRLAAVELINGEAAEIVREASQRLWQADPELLLPGGNAYTTRRWAACLRDMEIVLRYVTYAVFTGDASVLEDRCLNGLRETYAALGVPGASVAEGIRKMKDAAIAIANDRNGITPGDCSALMSEIGTYFDRAAAAVA